MQRRRGRLTPSVDTARRPGADAHPTEGVPEYPGLDRHGLGL